MKRISLGKNKQAQRRNICTVKCTGALWDCTASTCSVRAAAAAEKAALKRSLLFSQLVKAHSPLLIQRPLLHFWMTLGPPVSVSLGINKLKAVATGALVADDCNNVA